MGKLIQASFSFPPTRRNHIDVQVGARLRALRREAGLSFADIGIQLGLSWNAFSAIEEGCARATARQLEILCRLYKVTPTAIYAGVLVDEDDDRASRTRVFS